MNGNKSSSAVITLSEYTTIIRAQQIYLLRPVKIVRKQLISHGIVISNMAEKTFT